MIKKSLKTFSKYICIYISLLALFIITLIITSLFPQSVIQENVKESSDYLTQFLGINEKIGFKNIVLDTYTDALMINTAYSVDSKKPFESALLSRRSYDSERNLPEVGYKFAESDYSGENTLKDLQSILDKTNTRSYQYARYWHGYLIFLRPLLILFNYAQIRVLLTLILLIVSLFTCYIVFKKLGIYIGTVFLLGLIIFSFYFSGLSITYFSVAVIFMVSTIYILISKKKIKPYLFFIIGGLTSFFDLLTAPLLTLGIPLLMVVLKNNEKENKFTDIIIYCINWALGYLTIWLSKWILADLFYNRNIIKDAVYSILERTSFKNYTFIDILIKNNTNICFEMLFVVLLTMISIIIYLIKNKSIKIDYKTLLTYGFIAIIPIAWFFVTKGHSYGHAKYTYRILFITYLALLSVDYKIFKALKKE